MASAVIVMLGINAWQSWQQYVMSGRIAVIAETSERTFRVLHNLRVDRAQTVRGLNAANPITTETKKTLTAARAGEVRSLHAAASLLAQAEMADGDSRVAELQKLTKSSLALHAESLPALDKPKAERRDGIAN